MNEKLKIVPMNMKLQCIAEECNWESQDLNEGLAEKMLDRHLQLVHQVTPVQPQVGGAGVKKPTAMGKEVPTRSPCVDTFSHRVNKGIQG